MVQEFSDDGVLTHWQARLRDFCERCAESLPEEEGKRIREARALLRQAGALPWGAPPVELDPAALEAMLAAGACESAAMALLGPEVAFMLSRSSYGICMASVVLPGGRQEATAEGRTLVLALLAALAVALIEHAERQSWLASLANVPHGPRPA